ncbi:galactose-binding domain-containing protein [Streptomyces milbemycinicus]|uniref:galactose-binding domain-containing protein n=1 Tax=Streptomyces milbemycinicus TaxID=476552 RepID=UPI0033E35E28
MNKTLTAAAVAGALTAGMTLATSAENAVAAPSGKPRPDVVMWASPAAVSASELPCLPTSIAVTLTNTGTEPVFADATLKAEAPLVLSDTLFQTYLPPNNPAQPVTKSFGVLVPRGTKPGTYDITVTSGKHKEVVPVTVQPVPERGPGANLAYGEQAIASSTHGNFTLCGAVDGDKDQSHWDTLTGWNDATRDVFPDWYGVQWPTVHRVDRAELWTKTPAATSGIRDFDIQIRDGDTWRTVAQVVGNTEEHIVTTFPAEQTDAVRVLIHFGRSNYSRLVELEVYGPQ